MKMFFQYCLTCGRICMPFDCSGTEAHFSDQQDVDGFFLTCTGPFADSTPPELPENWDDLVTEPSPEELDEMDASAESLIFDLMGII